MLMVNKFLMHLYETLKPGFEQGKVEESGNNWQDTKYTIMKCTLLRSTFSFATILREFLKRILKLKSNMPCIRGIRVTNLHT